MKIKEILDKYEVKYGDIFYSKDTGRYYMIAMETELYGNPYIINMETGYVHVCSWTGKGTEAVINFFENSDVELVDKDSLLKGITNMEGEVL